MDVLLLGGTGPIGIHLTKILTNKHINVFVTSRKHRINYGNVVFIQGNAKEDAFANEVLSGRKWDCIIDFMVYNTVELKNRINMLLGSTNQYVFLSSSRVYANSETPITEDSSRLLDVSEDNIFLKTDEYALCKAREEDIIRQSGYNNYTIVRPYITYAENRLPLGVWEKETWVRRLLRNKTLVLPTAFLACETTICYGLDVAKCIGDLVGNIKSIGQIYNITSNKSHKWKEILDYYLVEIERITSNKPKVIEVNAFKYSSIKSYFISFLTFGLYRHTIYNYQLIYDREFNRCFNNKKLMQLIPECTFADYNNHLGDCLRIFAGSPHYDYINWRWEAVQDKISGEKTCLKEIQGFKQKIIYLLIRYFIPKKFLIS